MVLEPKDTLVIYHAGCMDGFGAAWVARRYLGDSADYLACHYDQTPPPVDGYKKVYVLDFSFARDVIEKWQQHAQVIIIDHHVSAFGELAGLKGYHFSSVNSGCVMTWMRFYGDREKVPMFLRFIEDRDLWKWELADSREINKAMYNQPRTFAQFDFFAHWLKEDNSGSVYRDLLYEGMALLRADKRIIVSHCENAEVLRWWRNYAHIPIVNCTVLHSEVGEALCEAYDAPFSVTYKDLPNGRRKYELRTIRDDVDVSEIAARFGGGGHRKAAGFTEAIGHTEAVGVGIERR